jgi:hypothetical protein
MSLKIFGNVLLLVLLALATAGCGSGQPTGDIVETVPAAGVLTYQGKPLQYYQVMLLPLGQRPAAGITDESGRFVLGTNGEGDGAVAGNHQVAVTYVGPPNTNPEAGMNDFSPPPPPKIKIPVKYRDVKTSGLRVEVPEGGTDDLKIDLK